MSNRTFKELVEQTLPYKVQCRILEAVPRMLHIAEHERLDIALAQYLELMRKTESEHTHTLAYMSTVLDMLEERPAPPATKEPVRPTDHYLTVTMGPPATEISFYVLADGSIIVEDGHFNGPFVDYIRERSGTNETMNHVLHRLQAFVDTHFAIVQGKSIIPEFPDSEPVGSEESYKAQKQALLNAKMKGGKNE